MQQVRLNGIPQPYKMACGALIYSKNTKRYLFLLRNRKFSGSWGLVGGKVEQDESAINALHREMFEEIQYSVTDDNKFIPIETFTSDDENFKYHTYLVVVDNEFLPILNDEHRGYCWVEIKDVPKPLHPGFWKTFNFNEVIDKLSTVTSII